MLHDDCLVFVEVRYRKTTRFSDPAVTVDARKQGKIVRTEAQIDTASRMVHVIARVENATQEVPLSVGLFVKAEIDGLLVEDVVVLPRNALRNGNRVLVVDADNKLYFRDIDPLRLYRDEVLVRGGLEAGERVCISPLQTAVDGMMVEPITEPSTGGADPAAARSDRTTG